MKDLILDLLSSKYSKFRAIMLYSNLTKGNYIESTIFIFL